jgi:hypothetical protein
MTEQAGSQDRAGRTRHAGTTEQAGKQGISEMQAGR